MKHATIRRRSFLKTAPFLAAAPVFAPARALGLGDNTPPSDRVQAGCIGVGSRGTEVMKGFLLDESCRVAALCDVKSNVLADRLDLVNNHYGNEDCKAYRDYQAIVEREDIDACLVATCDHWHVLASLHAAQSGKDVYCEKPLGLSLEQDLALRKAVHEHGRIFQFGTQQRSDPKFQLACQWVREGKIGEVNEVNVWSPGSEAGGDPAPAPVPEWLDYPRWLGPAPFKHYTRDRCSNSLWWFVSDYALGFIAGWGIHPVDIALLGLPDRFDGPWTLEGTGEFPETGVADTALNWDVRMQTGSGLKMRFTGLPQPAAWKERYGEESGHGTAFEGSEGWIYVRRGKVDSSRKDLLDHPVAAGASDSYLEPTNAHVSNFLESVRTRERSRSDIDVSVTGDAICHVSDIAIRLGRGLEFDAAEETFIGDAEANRRLKRYMRPPWTL